jgi:hypothetical protein
MDSASSLALLQEGLIRDILKKEPRRQEYYAKSAPKQEGYSRPQPPPPTSKAPQFSSPEEKKHVEALRLQNPEDVLSAIKAYRRAKGLCYKCGVKWNQNHRCAPTVSLHVAEEL